MNDFFVTIGSVEYAISFERSGLAVTPGISNEPGRIDQQSIGIPLDSTDKKLHYSVIRVCDDHYILRANNVNYSFTIVRKTGNSVLLFCKGHYMEAVAKSALEKNIESKIRKPDSAGKRIEIKSPMPGMVIKIKKQEGESVSAGESILILEAMKMENDIKAPSSGILKKVLVQELSPVEKGVPLCIIENL